MNEQSRPLIHARLVEDGRGARLQAPRNVIHLDPESLDRFRRIYLLADGRTRIDEMDVPGVTRAELLELFDGLQAHGACLPAHSAAMTGHLFAGWPDPLLLEPPADEVARLTVLPPEPDGISLLPLHAPLAHANRVRHSARDFTGESLTFAELSSILLGAYGHRGDAAAPESRTVPSAGAMYPLELHVFALRIRDLPSGHYVFAKNADAIYLRDANAEEKLAAGFFDEDWRSAALVVVIGFDVSRSAAKYGSRALRFALLEAGHCAQNALREATELEIGSWEHGGYHDGRLERGLALDDPQCGIATALLFGRRR